MLQSRTYARFRAVFPFAVAPLLCLAVATIGCGGAISSSHMPPSRDPLHLGASPGPLGSINPQTIEVRLGSEPNKRIVSLSLITTSLKVVNSGAGDIELLTAPVTFEFTNTSISTQPVFAGPIYQDTYSSLVLPDMTGQVVFFNDSGNLQTQALNVAGQTVSLTDPLVLGAGNPEVLSISVDLNSTFSVSNTVTVNGLAVSSAAIAPNPVGNQPETGSSSFLVGKVTAVDTGTRLIALQASAGDALSVAYSGTTSFVNCDPSMLTGMMVETESVTKVDGSIVASQVVMINNSASSSELYGTLGGLAPDGFNYNLIVNGGVGVNYSTGLIGSTITVDWLASSYGVNTAHLALDLTATANQDLVFDETHVFPGQTVQVSGDALLVPDPDSANAGFIQPGMMELETQTIAGTVSAYTFDSGTQTGNFTLAVDNDSVIKRMNGGLIAISVRQVPQTYLRNSLTFNNGDTVKVRGLLFAGCSAHDGSGNCLDEYSNVNYNPASTPVAFTLVADRISQ